MALTDKTIDRLINQLTNSQTAQSDQALRQVIVQLIKRLKELESALNASGSSVSGIANSTFVTTGNEVLTLPNSSQIIAGDNIEFDITIPNQIKINAVPINAESITNSQIIELFKYAFRRLDLIEELLGVDRTPRDIPVPEEDLELIQDSPDGDIGTRSMR
jgi:hypothetical protein